MATTSTTSSSEVPTPIARDHHFVPQGLLRRWSPNGKTVWTYNLLVPDSRVPMWSSRPIRGVAVRRDLYTTHREGTDDDEVEKWFASEFEQPGLEASAKLVDGRRIGRAEWHAIVRLYALQALRTPLDFSETMVRWEKDMPGWMEDSLRTSIQEYSARKAGPRRTAGQDTTGSAFRDVVEVTVNPADEEHGNRPYVQAKVIAGRAMWLASVKSVLSGGAMARLLDHTWRILEPSAGEEWPLTDSPALRLSFRSDDDFDYGAGWGIRNADLMMPLSPRHLLHTQVGKERHGVEVLSAEATARLQRVLAGRAFRAVFSTTPLGWIESAAPRVVDKGRFDAEHDAWERWHTEQTASQFR
jgi:hypothetical protein